MRTLRGSSSGNLRTPRPGSRLIDDLIVARGVCRTHRPPPSWLRLIGGGTTTQPIVALDNVDLTIGVGERCTLLGPNGAGKSTLLHILLGLVQRDAGQVTIAGIDPDDGRAARRLIGWVPPDDRNVAPRLTCRENLQRAGRLHGQRDDNRVAELLARMDLTSRADDIAASLSSGLRARLQIVAALVHRPALLLLDEVTTSLDPRAAHDMLELVASLHDDGTTVVLTSHRLDEVHRLGGRVVVLDDGIVRHDGDVAELGRDALANLLHLPPGAPT